MQKHFADLKRLASIKRENAKHNSPELLSLGCWRWMIQRVEETAQSRGLGDYYWTEGQDNILYAFLVITPREALPIDFIESPLSQTLSFLAPGRVQEQLCMEAVGKFRIMRWPWCDSLTWAWLSTLCSVSLLSSQVWAWPNTGLGMRCGHLSLCKIKSGPLRIKSCTSERQVEVLTTPLPVNVTLLRKSILEYGINLRSTQYDLCPSNTGKWRQTQRGEHRVKTQIHRGKAALSPWRLLQGKEQLGLWEAVRGKEGSCPGGFRGCMALPRNLISNFKPLDLERNKFLLFKDTQVVALCRVRFWRQQEAGAWVLWECPSQCPWQAL